MYGSLQIAPTGYLNEGSAPNFGGTTAISVYRNLIASNYFASLVKMYDQFRLDSCKIKIIPTQSVLLRGQKQAVFVSAWDRNGISNPKGVPSFSEIASYSSAFQKAVNMDATSWSATRKIYASSIQEKGLFLPTSTLNDSLFSGANVSSGQQTIAPWNPQLLFGVMCASTTPVVNDVGGGMDLNTFVNYQTWNYIIQFEWGVTFRGLRYDSPDEAAPLVNANYTNNTTAAVALGQYNIQPNDPPAGAPNKVIPNVQPAVGLLPPTGGTTYFFNYPKLSRWIDPILMRHTFTQWFSGPHGPPENTTTFTLPGIPVTNGYTMYYAYLHLHKPSNKAQIEADCIINGSGVDKSIELTQPFNCFATVGYGQLITNNLISSTVYTLRLIFDTFTEQNKEYQYSVDFSYSTDNPLSFDTEKVVGLGPKVLYVKFIREYDDVSTITDITPQVAGSYQPYAKGSLPVELDN